MKANVARERTTPAATAAGRIILRLAAGLSPEVEEGYGGRGGNEEEGKVEEVAIVQEGEGYQDDKQAGQGYEDGFAGLGEPEGQVGDEPSGGKEEESEDGVGAIVQEGEAKAEDYDYAGS